MKIILSAVLIFMLLKADTCNKQADCIDPAKIDTMGICTREYAPVCGCDGETYSNKCEAEKHGLLQWTEGACPEEK